MPGKRATNTLYTLKALLYDFSRSAPQLVRRLTRELKDMLDGIP
jgi:hypothetical protein